MPADELTAVGSTKESANYKLFDAAGQPTPAGTSESSNYKLGAGVVYGTLWLEQKPSTEVWVSFTTGSNTTGAGTVDNPYQTITFAMTMVLPGGTIHAFGDVYPEYNINWTSNDNVTLKASLETAMVTIDAHGAGRIISVNTAVNLSIESMTLQNGYATDGGAIYLTSGCNLYLAGDIFRYCSSEGGSNAGAISANNSSIAAIDCEFLYNRAGNVGGAANGGTWSIKGSRFIGNYGSWGGVVAYGSGVIENSSFTGNHGATGGGVLYSGTWHISSSEFRGNTAESWAGGGVFNNSAVNTVNCIDSTFEGNSAPGGGNGGVAAATTIVATNCVFNNSSANSGGVFYYGDYITTDRCRFNGNSAAQDGGVAAAPGIGINFIDSVFTNNHASGGNGGVVRSGRPVTVINCTFESNSSSGSGGVANLDDIANWTSSNCAYVSNEAANSGVAYGKEWYDTGSVFHRNRATGGHGGVFNGVTSTATECVFSENSASQNGGISYNGELHAINCDLRHNHALNGGVVSDQGLYATNTVLSGNFATQYGGVVYNGHLTFVNSTVFSNTAETGGVVYLSSNFIVKNTICYANNAPNFPVFGDNVSNISLLYSDMQPSGWFTPGGASLITASISAEPQFASTDDSSPDFLELGAGSPCIDTASIEAPSTDLAGNTRPHGFGVDMGVYEFQGPSVLLIQPNGWEILNTGEAYDIVWVISGEVTGSVTIRFSSDGGATWSPVNTVTAVPGITTYEGWEAPDLVSDQCLISIEVQGNGVWNYDVSDDYFSIDHLLNEVYISPSGYDDTGDGSIGNPYKTLNKGLHKVLAGGKVYAMQGVFTIEAGAYLQGSMALWPKVQDITLKLAPGATQPATFDAQGLGRVLKVMGNSRLTIESVSIVNGSSYTGAGIYIMPNCRFVIKDSLIENCTASVGFSNGGGIYYDGLNPPSGFISAYATDCIFRNNSAGFGGAIYNFGYSNSRWETNRCVFSGNHAIYGAVFFGFYGTMFLKNSIFFNNHATSHGGVSHYGVYDAYNCIFAYNRADADGGVGQYSGWYCRNSILYFNSAGDNSDLFYNYGDWTPPYTSYSDIQPSDYFVATGNISVEPGFLTTDEASADFLKHAPGDPCIDRASSTTSLSTDFNGASRPVGFGYDIGAYEFPGPSILVIQPNVLVTLEAGTTYDIMWKISGEVSDNVIIRLSTNEGATWDTLVTSGPAVLGVATFEWTVSDFASTGCLISIEAQHDGVWNCDISDIAFTILGSLNVVYISPTGSDEAGDGSYANPYMTVQKGVNRVAGGGEVMMLPGTYNTSLDRNVLWPPKQNVTLKLSPEATEPATVDAVSSGRFISLEAAVSLTLEDFHVKNTSLNTYGGTIWLSPGSSLGLRNMKFEDCSSVVAAGGVVYAAGAAVSAESCSFTGCSANGGGVVYGGTFEAYNSYFANNYGGSAGGGVFIAGTMNAYNCTFEGNSAVQGGVAGPLGTVFNAVNSIFKSNQAGKGGVFYYVSSTLTNCAIYNNHAGDSGFANDGVNWVVNCTVFGNTADANGVSNFGTFRAVNSIFSGNYAPSYPVFGPIFVGGKAATYSDIQQDGFISGTGNISAEPRFVSTFEGTAGYLELGPGSPCIDTADPDHYPADDLVGHVRPHGFNADMGVYEFQGPSVRVITPNDGQDYGYGANVFVFWRLDGDLTGYMNVWLSTNEGASWDYLITSELAATGYTSYVWAVPNIPTTECLISVEVSDTSGLMNYDICDRTFSISGVLAPVYVSLTGSDDAGDGSLDNPYLTVQHGLDKVASGGELRILPGEYLLLPPPGPGYQSLSWLWPNRNYVTIKLSPEATGAVTLEGNNQRILRVMENKSLTIESITFHNAQGYYNGGAILLEANCELWLATVEINSCRAAGGPGHAGGVFAESSKVHAFNSSFTGNSATSNSYGGFAHGGTWEVVNCVFAGNKSDHGGVFSQAVVTALNCTFFNNTGEVNGGVAYDSTFTGRNCIFWSNNSLFDSSTVTLSYSDVQGGYSGTGNITAEPRFASIDPSNANFLKLGAGSPCIDMASIEAPSTDKDGNPRPIGLGYDMGAYEFQGPSLIIIQPNGEEHLQGGQNYDVMFDVSPETTEIYIRLSTNEGATWSTLVTHEIGCSRTGVSTYEWTVNEVDSALCLISIEAYGNGLWNCDTSDATFEIISSISIFNLYISREADALGSAVILSWNTTPDGASVDVYTKADDFSMSASDWNPVPEFTGITSGALKNDNQVRTGHHKWYKVVRSGATLTDDMLTLEVLGKFDLVLPNTLTDPTKFFISTPLELFNKHVTNEIASQASEGDMIMTFNIKADALTIAQYTGGAWKNINVTPYEISTFEIELGKSYGYWAVGPKNISLVGRVYDGTHLSTLEGGDVRTKAAFIGVAYPFSKDISLVGLNGSSIGNHMMDAGGVYLFDVNQDNIKFGLHTGASSWIIYQSSDLILEPGRGYIFIEPIKTNMEWVQGKP